jgi:hypothetical protein
MSFGSRKGSKRRILHFITKHVITRFFIEKLDFKNQVFYKKKFWYPLVQNHLWKLNLYITQTKTLIIFLKMKLKRIKLVFKLCFLNKKIDGSHKRMRIAQHWFKLQTSLSRFRKSHIINVHNSIERVHPSYAYILFDMPPSYIGSSWTKNCVHKSYTNL